MQACYLPNVVGLSCGRVWVTLLHTAVGRSDDSRMLFVCDLCRPNQLSIVGALACFTFSLVLRGGKKMQVGHTDKLPCHACAHTHTCAHIFTPRAPVQNGQVDYVTMIRHFDPVMCPVRAMAQMFWARFTRDREPYPDPNKQAW